MSDDARKLLRQARAVLLDFDGPVCSVFAGRPAPEVAESIRQQLLREGHTLGDLGLKSPDPLDVLRDAATGTPDGAVRCEALLAEAELACIATATPTPGASEVIKALDGRGVPIAIVSNNSRGAIEHYLRAQGLSGSIAFLSTRDATDARLMKPSPHLLNLALDALCIPAGSAVMIGDTANDMAAAVASGTKAIGYANRDSKRAALSEHGADAVVDTMLELVVE